ncbi:MAG: TIGR04182 family glycosyltransferase, partial [Nanoarchaeota archaeon]|nr:TIGR04182 family glycosyltransferase [Nanoarchaeota archaeon]
IGIILFTFGMLVGLYVVYHILQYGGTGGTPRVVLSALLILTGVQVVLFGFMADMKK